jgi:hypothetical protein
METNHNHNPQDIEKFFDQDNADPAEEWNEQQNPQNVGQNTYNDFLGDDNRDHSQDSEIDLPVEPSHPDESIDIKPPTDPTDEFGATDASQLEE